MSHPTEIMVGETLIELLFEQEQFLGFGKITVKGIALRSPSIAMMADIETPDGIHYDSFRLEEVENRGSEIVLVTTAFGKQRLYGEYRDEYDIQLAWPRISKPIEDIVEWCFNPETLTLDEVCYEGFSYSLRFFSKERSIHQFTMVSSWELGGSAEGNTLLYQGQVNPPVYHCEKDTSFTSTCWRTLGEAGNPHGVSFQFCSRYSPIQCFDFQYGSEGTLIGYWPDFIDVHSLIQKNQGEDVVFVLDKCLMPLTKEFVFPRKCILWAGAPAEGARDHLMHDRWLRVREHAEEAMRAKFDIKKPYLRPETRLTYKCGLDDDGKLLMYIGGKPYTPENTLAGWAEHFPALAAAGVRRIFPEPVSESDITENGYAYKLQTGIHGDLVTSSVCMVWNYKMAEFWGGWKAWGNFYQAGKDAGLEVGQWIGSNLSRHAPILKEHPEFICEDVNIRPHSGGSIIYGINWNLACDWLLEAFAEWKRHGLDYVFFDSIGNFGFLGVDYKENMQPNAAGLARFIGGLNAMGISAITNEGISPVGIGCFGMADNKTEKEAASIAVAGQNDWSWWVGHEDMLVGVTPLVFPHSSRTERELHEQCFRALANYSLLIFYAMEEADEWPKDLDAVAWYYKTYNQVEPLT